MYFFSSTWMHFQPYEEWGVRGVGSLVTDKDLCLFKSAKGWSYNPPWNQGQISRNCSDADFDPKIEKNS